MKILSEELYFDSEKSNEEESLHQSTITENISKEETSKIKINILNGSGSKNKLKKVQKLIEDSGYEVTTNETTAVQNKTIIINTTNVDKKYINHIKGILGVEKISENGIPSNDSNITIIVGKDYK